MSQYVRSLRSYVSDLALMISMVLNFFRMWIGIAWYLSDCTQTQWSDWGKCNCKGDKGTWSRNREIVIEPEYNGTECGPNEATEACPSGKCVGISKDYIKDGLRNDLFPAVHTCFPI